MALVSLNHAPRRLTLSAVLATVLLVGCGFNTGQQHAMQPVLLERCTDLVSPSETSLNVQSPSDGTL